MKSIWGYQKATDRFNTTNIPVCVVPGKPFEYKAEQLAQTSCANGAALLPLTVEFIPSSSDADEQSHFVLEIKASVGALTADLINRLQTENPLISERAARRLIEVASARGYNGADTGQLVETAVKKGRPALSRADQSELDAMYARAFSVLSDVDKRALSSYSEKLSGGQEVSSFENQTAGLLVLKGFRNLPQSTQVQFRNVFSKMIELGLSRLE